MKKYTFTNSFSMGEDFWKLLGWGALILITGGLAFPFFIYYFVRDMLHKTEIYEHDAK